MAEGFIRGRRIDQIERIKHGWNPDSKVVIPNFTCDLEGYQLQGSVFLIAAQRALLPYFVGSGKTPISIGGDVYLRNKNLVKRTLVIGLIGGRWQWQKEYRKYTNLSTVVVEGAVKQRERTWIDGFRDMDVTITHYETVRRDADLVVSNGLNYDLVILDEASYFRTRGTKIGKALRKIVAGKEYVWGLTATPIQKRLEDLFWIMNIINYPVLGSFKNFKERYIVEEEIWIKRGINLRGKTSRGAEWGLVDETRDFVYCGVKAGDRVVNTISGNETVVVSVGVHSLDLKDNRDIFMHDGEPYRVIGDVPRARRFKKPAGYKNLDELNQRMDLYFLRKTQDDVATIDRRRVRVPRAIEMTTKQIKKYQEVLQGLDEISKERKSLLERFQLLEYACGTTAFFDPDIRDKYMERESLDWSRFDAHDSAKLDDILFLLDGELDEEKVVVFSKYRIMLYHAMRVFDSRNIKWTEITGDVKDPEQRELNRVKFIEDPDVRVCLLSSVGEMSFNLHSARYIVFLNEIYNPARQEQLIGRIDRPFLQQAKIITSIHYYTHASFEPSLHDRMDSERALAEEFFGDRDIIDQMTSEELFALIRGRDE